MEQHYFIGVKVPTHFEAQVEQVRERYRLRDTYKVIPHIEDFHVTLLYLGAVSEHRLSSLKQMLAVIAGRHLSFSIDIDGLSYFGSSSGPRVVYLAINHCVPLTSLQREINTAVSHHLALPLFNRFVPHVTIAKKRKDSGPVFIEKETFKPIEVLVQSFSLFAVHPHKTPKYEAIESFHLQ